VVADARGVGRNLQNHPGVDLQFASSHEDSLTAELNLRGRAKLAAEWVVRKKGLGTTNFFETGAFLRTRDDVVFPNVQFEFLPLTRRLQRGRLVPIPGFQFWIDLSRPQSRGAVTLRSADPADAPLVVFNHLEAELDVRELIDAVRLARTLAGQAAWDRYRREELAPGPDVRSDREIEAFLRRSVSTSYQATSSNRCAATATPAHHSSGLASRGVVPVVSQPCPCDSARRMPFGPLAAITNSGRGRCTGPGTVRASTAPNQSPDHVVRSWRSSRSSSVTNSSKRRCRCPSVRAGWPRIAASKPGPPAPIAVSNRPPDMTSSVISSFENGTGWRKFGDATNVPNLIVEVVSAAAVSTGTVAYHGESAWERQARWSKHHACANPYASMRAHRSSRAGSTSGSIATPTLVIATPTIHSWSTRPPTENRQRGTRVDAPYREQTPVHPQRCWLSFTPG
jgi:GMC oxidoreductase